MSNHSNRILLGDIWTYLHNPGDQRQVKTSSSYILKHTVNRGQRSAAVCYLQDMVQCSADVVTLTLTVHIRTPQRHTVNC